MEPFGEAIRFWKATRKKNKPDKIQVKSFNRKQKKNRYKTVLYSFIFTAFLTFTYVKSCIMGREGVTAC